MFENWKSMVVIAIITIVIGLTMSFTAGMYTLAVGILYLNPFSITSETLKFILKWIPQ